ncbi:arsenate reductase (glutaredoxin) [Litorilituus lipolyticus]|uniref:Arsenate reductase n=1 Tax=Litorilituus lipolyticus TaxID=2491017 RepID=A0A502L1U4_9GAMM|nr:arsenate reductase (glutaredoxin) [Litorilituus lipolyticus]TPH16435.1 arsenate reductase (glutaredoxin) [Litorilituus lipolyticus]
MFTIYHNPRCSKSRQTLALLEPKAQENQQEITIVEYLKTPLSEDEIKALLSQLSCNPIDMMRTKEDEFKEQNLKGADDATLISAMANTPKLVERPIVSNGDKAIIGRPPENVLAFFAK